MGLGDLVCPLLLAAVRRAGPTYHLGKVEELALSVQEEESLQAN